MRIVLCPNCGESVPVPRMPRQSPTTSKQDYATPDIFMQAVYRKLKIAAFDIDLAADLHNRKAKMFLDKEDDSLSPRWDWATLIGHTHSWAWLNPPYKRIEPWAAKCAETGRQDRKIAFLVPASVGSNWYRDHIHNQPGTQVLFLNGRIPFMPDKPNWLYPKDCILVLFGLGGGPYKPDTWTWREETTDAQKVMRAVRRPRARARP